MMLLSSLFQWLLCVAVIMLTTSTIAFGKPVECPYKGLCGVISSKSACDSMGGDWNPTTKKCTIYVSEGADDEGDPRPQKGKSKKIDP